MLSHTYIQFGHFSLQIRLLLFGGGGRRLEMSNKELGGLIMYTPQPCMCFIDDSHFSAGTEIIDVPGRMYRTSNDFHADTNVPAY